ncbi:MAG: rRNA maturation RNase YbeY [Burkholderiaceae bacterium]
MATCAELSLLVQCGDGVASLPADRAQIRRWVAAAAEMRCELTLRFVGLDEGRQLNARFRGRDYATNVLTFPYDAPDVAIADIVVCLPVVEREAREQDKPLAEHLAHMIVHGVLHAQGYDHEDDDDATLMEARERRILARFRIADPYRERG